MGTVYSHPITINACCHDIFNVTRHRDIKKTTSMALGYSVKKGQLKGIITIMRELCFVVKA
jgi:hypothetical protein